MSDPRDISGNWCCRHEQELAATKKCLANALLEIATLRQYGNKDCIGQADEELARLGHPAFTGEGK